MSEIKQDLNQFHSLHPNRKLAVFAILLFLFALAIGIGIFISRNSSSKTSGDLNKGTAGSAVYSLLADSETLSVGEQTPLYVEISGDEVTVADVVLSYDPTIIKVSDPVIGTAFDDELPSEIKDGYLRYSVAVNPDQVENTRLGTVATFTVTALKKGSTEIVFNEKSRASIAGQNILGDTNPLKITVK